MTRKKLIDVEIPQGYKPLTKDVNAAWILARYYGTVVKVLKPVNRYKVTTPDFEFNSKEYELKVLTSAQVVQLFALLGRAMRQSCNIIIDIRKTKITEKRAMEICKKFCEKNKGCNVLLIVSAQKVVDTNKRDV